MTELMNEAIKDGVTPLGGTPPADKVSAPATEKVESTPASGAPKSEEAPKPATPVSTSPEKVRFEDNPGFKNVLRQRDSVREELRKAQEANERLLSLIEERSKPKPSEQSDGQEAAAKQLRQLLGIDDLVGKIDSLDKRNSEYSQSQTNQAFDQEQDKIVKQCEKFGLDFNEVAPELETWLNEHPYFGRLKEFQPGFFDIAFKALYFDKSTELAKRAAQADQLKTVEKLRSAGSEAPSPAQGSGAPPVYTGVRDIVKRRIEEAGGVSFPG